VDWLPEVALLPDHAPEAAHEVALVEDQVSMEDPLLATDVGFAASETIGDGGGGVLPVQFAGVDPPPPQAVIATASRGTSSRVRICRIAIPLNDAMMCKEEQMTKRWAHRFAEKLAHSRKIIRIGSELSAIGDTHVGDWRQSKKHARMDISVRYPRVLANVY
jgi:hypothetical protein